MNETDWSEPDVSGLPTGTVTLLLADVEGSTPLWSSQPGDMTAAVARLDHALVEAVAANDGFRPVEQGEGDSFVIAFARASDALACALELQRAPLAPIRLRIGLHTGDVQLRDEGNYIGPTINRTARLRNLAHGGQTVLSGAMELMVVDQLPPGVWLTDLGTHPLRGMTRPERVVQLCHPDLHNDFPPLRTDVVAAAHNLPVQLTNFVGRQAEMARLREVLAANRLVILTGAGGAGKTRLAVQVAAELADEFADGVCYVDLAPITHPEVVMVSAARAMGLPDQPGRSTLDTLLRFVRDRHMLLVLDNCEHLLDSSASLVVAILGGAPGLTVLATSREPLNVPGEAIWLVPSLSLAGDAVELFTDRARLACAEFNVTGDGGAAVAEICRRLDGMPLAIELAAARVRAMSLSEILVSLHDRFRLLTGGSRTVVRRQQTLRASVDWSHALLTEIERILFRRLAVFLGGFDLDAVRAVAGADGVERYQVLDQLTLLVDKSLVIAENTGGRTRYRLLETMRQYGLEKLGESGEADLMRSRQRDYYTAMAAVLDTLAGTSYEERVELAELEMDNLRGAFGWSLENADVEQALSLASSLQPLWVTSGHLGEGLAWFDAAFKIHGGDLDVAPPVHARALADKAVLDLWSWSSAAASLDQAQKALAIARAIDDPALVARALFACGHVAGYSKAGLALPYFAEAAELARALDDRWRLSQILAWQSNQAVAAGNAVGAQAAGDEGRDLADVVGDRYAARLCGVSLGWAAMMRGDLVAAEAQFRAVAAESEDAHDLLINVSSLAGLATTLAHQGRVSDARVTADAGLAVAAELGGFWRGMAHSALVFAGLAAGDVEAAKGAGDAARQRMSFQPQTAAALRAHSVEVALARGDLVAALSEADKAVATSTGWHLSTALAGRARAMLAQGERGQAERDAHEALVAAADSGAYLAVANILECLAEVTMDTDMQRAARLFGASDAFRRQRSLARFEVYEAGYQAAVVALRNTLSEDDFDTAWAEGAALPIEEAIAYAQRGRGERKRPASGWASLTPAELDVARLVREGRGNKDIAARLFVSPRTVQTHLTHIFTKLGFTSRVQLAQEAAKQMGQA